MQAKLNVEKSLDDQITEAIGERARKCVSAMCEGPGCVLVHLE